jgi:hypothetical protein
MLNLQSFLRRDNCFQSEIVNGDGKKPIDLATQLNNEEVMMELV